MTTFTLTTFTSLAGVWESKLINTSLTCTSCCGTSTLYVNLENTNCCTSINATYSPTSTTAAAIKIHQRWITGTTSTSTCNWGMIYDYDWGYDSCKTPIIAPEKALKKIIRERCSPNVFVHNSKRQPLPIPSDIREQRARETLRRVVGDQKFLNFIKNGFISVKAKSGLIYQIFPGGGITHVFNQGDLVDRLCVVLQGNFPPTDSLIMRYLLILNNEQQFNSLAIKHSIAGNFRPIKCDVKVQPQSLIDIFRELKAIKAA